MKNLCYLINFLPTCLLNFSTVEHKTYDVSQKVKHNPSNISEVLVFVRHVHSRLENLVDLMRPGQFVFFPLVSSSNL